MENNFMAHRKWAHNLRYHTIVWMSQWAINQQHTDRLLKLQKDSSNSNNSIISAEKKGPDLLNKSKSISDFT